MKPGCFDPFGCSHPAECERTNVCAKEPLPSILNVSIDYTHDTPKRTVPFQRPVFYEETKSFPPVLRDANCELICVMEAATKDECEFIVAAINAYEVKP